MIVAASTAGQILAIIGLAVGLVVFGVVIWLLQGVLTPLLKVKADVVDAATAPMLQHGVKGVDQIGRTQQLAQSVPDAAVGSIRGASSGHHDPVVIRANLGV